MNDNDRTPDLDQLDLVAVDRLRRTFEAVAAATPVEDRHSALLTAIDTPEPAAPDPEDGAMHLDARTDPARPVWRRPMSLAAAAALVVVAVLGAALSGDDDSGVELDPAVPDGGTATGWYVPPEGWEITEVRLERIEMGERGACPCRHLVAAGTGSSPPVVWLVESRDDITEGGSTERIDVGGRPGLVTTFGETILQAVSGDVRVQVTGLEPRRENAIGPDELASLADAWLDQIEAGEDVEVADLPLPAGLVAGPITAEAASGHVSLLDVTAVERATGRLIYYQVVPAPMYSTLAVDAGQVRVRDDGQLEVTTTFGQTPGVGLTGGAANVMVGPSHWAEEGDDLTVAELTAFLRGLRQVTTDEWRRAVGSGPAPSTVLAADSLFGPPLVDRPVDG